MSWFSRFYSLHRNVGSSILVFRVSAVNNLIFHTKSSGLLNKHPGSWRSRMALNLRDAKLWYRLLWASRLSVYFRLKVIDVSENSSYVFDLQFCIIVGFSVTLPFTSSCM